MPAGRITRVKWAAELFLIRIIVLFMACVKRSFVKFKFFVGFTSCRRDCLVRLANYSIFYVLIVPQGRFSCRYARVIHGTHQNRFPSKSSAVIPGNLLFCCSVPYCFFMIDLLLSVLERTLLSLSTGFPHKENGNVILRTASPAQISELRIECLKGGHSL